MKKIFAALGMATLSLLIVSSGSNEAGDKEKKPEFTISEVMAKGHKSGLMKKVASGKATKEEQKLLLGMYIAMHANVPPKGEAKEWQAKTQQLIDAAKGVLEGKEGAGKQLAKVTACAACHKQFK